MASFDMMSGTPTVHWGGRQYLLTPKPEGENSEGQERFLSTELQLFADPNLESVPVFEYKPLTAGKRVRLLQLRSGEIRGPEIFCTLIEADYDNSFHVLTRVMDKEKEEMKNQEEKEREEKGRKGKKLEEKKQTLEEMEKEAEAKLEKEWERVKDPTNEIEYEALSWCWGTSEPIYAVKIEEGGKTYKKKVRKELALALKYLRLPDRVRTLWVDALCIDQENHEERNRQVQMMSRIYTRSKEVCIWLGQGDDQSKLAIDFIHNEIKELKNFDTICSDRRYSRKWEALMMLMQRDWFSRRWVVQELALASKAKVYCGSDSILWKEFAVAVELFVEVETATHRLSEVMKKDEKYEHVPGWFEYVSELGASLLVQATGKVFRAQRTPLDDGPGQIETFKQYLDITKKVNTIDPLDRRSLLSLEYLVSTMFIFNATEPRDAVYALLAIARDAAPLAKSALDTQDSSFLITSLFDRFLEEKPFMVDYGRPYSDVCRDFVEFSIKRKAKLDPVQALDILCRPWALEYEGGTSIRLIPKAGGSSKGGQGTSDKQLIKRTKPFQKRKRKENIKNKERDEKDKKTPVKYKYYWEKKENVEDDGDDADWIEDEGCKDLQGDMKEYFKQYFEQYWKRIESGVDWVKDKWEKSPGWEMVKVDWDRKMANTDGGGSDSTQKYEETHSNKDIPVPLWVARASQAPFSLHQHPGMTILKTGRANADPLVGHPQDGHRNYSAAQTKGVDLKELRFKKRPDLGPGHYSIYVTGFVLDTVKEVTDASQGGNIPRSWLDLGDWKEPFTTDPPDKLWRTLVADRGRDNRNPPYYYARACKESVHKGGIASGRVDTTALINNERNSIVAEFCRRVHAVIWNRRLFKTQSDRLGLASRVETGDKVCIIYGCTVPVILRRHLKKGGEVEAEESEDKLESLKTCLVKMKAKRERKAKAMENLNKYSGEERVKLKEYMKKVNDILRKEGEEKARKEAEDEKKAEEGETRPPGGEERKLTNEEQEEKKEDERHKKKLIWYEFLGDSYIHGMMDGEALREKFYMRISDRTLELR